MKDREPFLIAYFAIKGKEESAATAKVAAQLGKKLTEKGVKFDTFAIVPTEEYPSEPANFELATKAEKENHARPELVGKYSGMKDVKDIFLVVPNWWNSLPQGVFTFLDDYDFSEKRLVPIVLHSGDGADEVVKELRNFIHKVWVMKEVVIKDSDVENCGTQIDEAIEEMFRP
ncbi:MAG: hypothetical protein K2G69_00995, partial [Muribaculaceae bacterium]|nr:hypothetical protein [Muribaculaceae bacterium]